MKTALYETRVPTLAERLAPGQAALLVIDVQNDFCHEQGAYFARLGDADLGGIQAAVGAMEGLIDVARRVRVPVVFIRAIYDPIYLSGPTLDRRARRGIAMLRCLDGTWGAEFYRLAPGAGEPVITKHRYSGFVGTDLDVLLRSWRVATVITVGIAADVCVASTARDAFMRDYYVVVPEDCTASVRPEFYRAALGDIERNFGVVVPSQTILEAWVGGPAPAASRGGARAGHGA